MKRILIYTLMILPLFAACKKTDANADGAKGSLEFKISYDTSYETNVSEPKKSVTSVADDAVDLGAFRLSLLKTGVSAPVENCTVAEFLAKCQSGLMELLTGEYTLSISSAADAESAWQGPVYGATETFNIYAAKVTALNVVCTLQNMKVSVNLSESFKAELATYEIVVMARDGVDNEGNDVMRTVTWTEEDVAAEKEAYFPVTPFSLSLKAFRALDGTPVQYKTNINDAEARSHYVFNIDVDQTGQAKSMISIDYTVNNVPKDILVNGFEEIPVDRPEEPGTGEETPGTPQDGEAAPTAAWATNPDFTPVIPVEGLDVTIEISAPGKIKTFVVEVSENFETLIAMVTGGPVYMDLIGNTELQANFADLGIELPTGDQLLNQTQVTFPLSAFVSIIAGMDPADYVFILKLEDQLGQKLEKTVTFRVPAN